MMYTKEQLEAACAAARVGAVKDERARIGAILSCSEAKSRQKMALCLALEMDVGVEAAQGMLAAAAKEGTRESMFAELMTKFENPDVGLEPPSPPGPRIVKEGVVPKKNGSV